MKTITQSLPTSIKVRHSQRHDDLYQPNQLWLNLETLSFLGCSSPQSIKRRLILDLTEAPTRPLEHEHAGLLYAEIDQLSFLLYERGQAKDKLFTNYLLGAREPNSAIRAHEAIQQLLCQAYIRSDDEILQQLDIITPQLKIALENNHPNAFLSFEIAWLYHHLYWDFKRALQHYQIALKIAHTLTRPESVELSLLILRHLSHLHIMRSEWGKATITANRALSYTSQHNLKKDKENHYSLSIYELVSFEMAHFYAADNQASASTHLLEPLLFHSPYLYSKTDSNLIFTNAPATEELLQQLYQRQMRKLERDTVQLWQDDIWEKFIELEDKNIPINFNTMIQEAIQLEKSSNKPMHYTQLIDNFSFASIVVSHATTALKKQLAHQYTHTKQQMKLLNKQRMRNQEIGRYLLTSSIILLITAIILLLLRDNIHAYVFGQGWGHVQWHGIFWALTNSILISAFIGILLSLFEPFGLKQLLIDKGVLINALDKLEQ